MTRKLRVEYPAAIYHELNRGESGRRRGGTWMIDCFSVFGFDVAEEFNRRNDVDTEGLFQSKQVSIAGDQVASASREGSGQNRIVFGVAAA